MNMHWPRLGRTPRLALLFFVGFLALGLTLTLPATALPILFGGQVYYDGGDLTVDVLYNDTVYDQVLQLWSGTTVFDIADGGKTGTSITLTQEQLAGMGIAVGDELQFGIHVLNTSHSFLAGPGSRNADGIDHAYVRGSRSGVYLGFEDLYGGGDRDYNDTIYRLTGVTTSPRVAGGPTTAPSSDRTSSVPEPGIVGLLLVGIGFLGYRYRKV